MILLTTLYFAMSLPANAPLQWWGPLTRRMCLRLARETAGTWCHAIKVPK